MDIGARLRQRWYLVILAAIIALLVGATTVVKLGGHGLKVKRSVYHVGVGQVLVDTNPSTLTNITAAGGALGGRAGLIAEYATGPQIVSRIASLVGLPASAITVQAQTTNATKTGGSASKGIASGGGANSGGAGNDSVLLRAVGQNPTITITSQAHKGGLAIKLVSATITAMTHALRSLQNSQAYNHLPTQTSTTATSTTSAPGAKTGKGSKKTGSTSQTAKAATQAQTLAQQKARQIQQSKLVLRPLGAVRATKVVVSPSKGKAIGYTVAAFVVLLLLILVFDALVRGPREAVAPPVAARSMGPSVETPTPEPSTKN